MGARHIVVLDACVLAPFGVCDLFLRLAEEPRLYSPHWTEQILDEVRRTQLAKLRWSEHLADHWRQEVTATFPEALITGHERLIGRCSNDEGDRHVLAAAIEANANAIVTYNLAHFPDSALEPHSIRARHPADYLCALYDSQPAIVALRVAEIAAARKIEPADVVRRLCAPLPRFATHVANAQGWRLPDEMPK